MVRGRVGMRMFLMLACFLATLPIQSVLAAEDAEEIEFRWYGYFKLDLAYDSAVSSHGNFIMYVKPHSQGGAAETVNITARQTRIGVNVLKGRSRGKIELDFYGGGTENKNLLMLRKAYLDVPLGGVSLLAGQASDLISPLVPATINYTVGWGAGNIGYRRPQLQIYADHGGTAWGLAVARNISEDLNGDSVLDGDASTVPVVQARLAQSFDVTGSRVTVGTSGHYGLMDSEGAAEDHYSTWSLNGELAIQVNAGARFLAEYYTGSNTGGYFGAILNGDTVDEVRSHGGWANLQVTTSSRTTVSVGAGMDDLKNEAVTLVGLTEARCCNAFAFANAVYEVQPGIQLGMEISGWRTRYANVSPGTDPVARDLRLQWSVQGSF